MPINLIYLPLETIRLGNLNIYNGVGIWCPVIKGPNFVVFIYSWICICSDTGPPFVSSINLLTYFSKPIVHCPQLKCTPSKFPPALLIPAIPFLPALQIPAIPFLPTLPIPAFSFRPALSILNIRVLSALPLLAISVWPALPIPVAACMIITWINYLQCIKLFTLQPPIIPQHHPKPPGKSPAAEWPYSIWCPCHYMHLAVQACRSLRVLMN